MKKNILSIFSLCALMGLSGCNAFLELEPLDKVSPDQLLETIGKHIYHDSYGRF